MPYRHTKQYRLYGYDYSQNGSYFITIVTKDRLHFFGEITDSKMFHNAIGQFVVDNIQKVIALKKDLIIDEWMVMPNHIHFLLTISTKNEDYNSVVGIQPLRKQSISAFANHFKGRVKKWCNDNNASGFDWQGRFHDRVVRNEKEYNEIAWYIRNNVANWEEDADFS